MIRSSAEADDPHSADQLEPADIDLNPDLDAQSEYSGDSQEDASVHSGSRRGISEDSYSTVSDEPAVTLLNFRRFSKMQASPILVEAMLGLSDGENDPTGSLPMSPKIITRKVVKDVDGKYRLETQTGKSRNSRNGLSGRNPLPEIMASSLTDDSASEKSGSTTDRLSLPNSKMRYTSDPNATSSGSSDNLTFSLEDDDPKLSSKRYASPKSKRFVKAPAGLTSFFKQKVVRIQEDVPVDNTKDIRATTNDTDWLY
ncbi:uncharacterized protein LOC129594175 [Paramacrobiotus metropolitanus]|uniref:uncharacterized protein LOC129594175 n=1 Tax=Paramacrobiotus metropolitanus TaxID=2943436 RepID=UPI002445E6D1|nr:uncharacterized protein LOC129594175 [Paramacrobiotus metropolitanus]